MISFSQKNETYKIGLETNLEFDKISKMLEYYLTEKDKISNGDKCMNFVCLYMYVCARVVKRNVLTVPNFNHKLF
jgi:hypothetical protein